MKRPRADAEDYAAANALWPAEIPPITRIEAERAVRRLYAHFVGRRRRKTIRVRRVWIALKAPTNGLSRGWRRLVHDISHRVFSMKNPGATDHGGYHARFEAEMIRYVLAQGWLSGSLRPKVVAIEPPSVAEKTEKRIERVQAAIARWETKRKRAETALKKLARRLRRYERTAARKEKV